MAYSILVGAPLPIPLIFIKFVDIYRERKVFRMKVKINESQLRHLIGESIRKVLNEAYGTDPHNMVFVTFGKGNSFDVGKMNNKPNEMHRVHLNITNKPFGLWGSPIDDEDGKTAWGKFVEYDYRNIINTLKEHFIFRVKPEAKIFVIDGEDSLRQLPWTDSQTGMIHVDWEKVEKMYDGVYLTDNYPRRALDYYTPSFDAWDCASICIFNPNVIEQVEESEADYNKIRDAYDYDSVPDW